MKWAMLLAVGVGGGGCWDLGEGSVGGLCGLWGLGGMGIGSMRGIVNFYG